MTSAAHRPPPPAPVAAPRSALFPGLAAALVVTAVATLVNAAVPQVSSLMVAVAIGIVLGNVGDIERLAPGLAFAAKRLLRVGVVLLGLRLSIGEVTALGIPTLVLVVATVAATFFGTQLLGRRLGLSAPLSLLVATGYSICGASAIAAMEQTSEAEEEEVAMAIGLVTMAGTLAMFTLPLIATTIGLSDQQFGTWVGASVHDVAQVVAAASTGGASVLAVAAVVKLTRVVLLAPIVAGVSFQRSRRSATVDGGSPPILPGFVVGFLAMVLLRSTGSVPADVVDAVKVVEGLLLTTALVGLGAGVRISRLRTLGGRPLVLGAAAWVLVAVVSLAGTSLLV